MLGEFGEFIARGNVIDLAVGVIIGGAFATITGSLTNGTVIVLRRRLRAMFNDGTSAGTPVVVRQFTEVFSDDFSGVNGMFEYDIGCPTTFGAGDTVSVELV